MPSSLFWPQRLDLAGAPAQAPVSMALCAHWKAGLKPRGREAVGVQSPAPEGWEISSSQQHCSATRALTSEAAPRISSAPGSAEPSVVQPNLLWGMTSCSVSRAQLLPWLPLFLRYVALSVWRRMLKVVGPSSSSLFWFRQLLRQFWQVLVVGAALGRALVWFYIRAF